MLSSTTKRPLTLSKGRTQLIKDRTPKKIRASAEETAQSSGFKRFEKKKNKWVLEELPSETSFLMLEYDASDTKVSVYTYSMLICIVL
jgi:hypothetical protein